MKFRQILIIAALLLGWVNSSNAKGYKPAKVYMFGFAASFNDSTVYMTDIQKVDAYLADNRTHFLANREDYSYQLRTYLQRNGLESHPTCVTVFSVSEKTAMKKYLKLKNRYENSKKKYTVKPLSESQFSYTAIQPEDVASYPEPHVSKKTAAKSKKAQAAKDGNK